MDHYVPEVVSPSLTQARLCVPLSTPKVNVTTESPESTGLVYAY